METINGSRRIRPDYGILRIRRGEGVLPHVVPVTPQAVVDVSGRPIGDVYPEDDPIEEENHAIREMRRMVRLVEGSRSDRHDC